MPEVPDLPPENIINQPRLYQRIRRYRDQLSASSFKTNSSEEYRPSYSGSSWWADIRHSLVKVHFPQPFNRNDKSTRPYSSNCMGCFSSLNMNFQRQDPAIVMANKEYSDGKGSQYRAPTVSAIFVHAGAGYHSTTNEQVHLGACNE